MPDEGLLLKTFDTFAVYYLVPTLATVCSKLLIFKIFALNLEWTEMINLILI